MKTITIQFRKKLIVLLILTFNFSQLNSQTTFWSESFTYADNSLTGIASGPQATAWNKTGAYTNTASQYVKVVSNQIKMLYNDTRDLSLSSDAITITGYTNIRVNFTVASSGTVDNPDNFYLKIYVDGVLDITGLLTNDNTGSFYIDALTEGSSMYIVFSNDFNASDEWYTIDDVYIEGTEAPASTSWIGGTSTSWATAANWSSGVPHIITDVTIPSGTTFAPTISASTSAYSGNLTINSGATLTYSSTQASGGVLKVYGNLLNNGTLSRSGGNVWMYKYGTSKTIGGTGIFNNNLGFYFQDASTTTLSSNTSVQWILMANTVATTLSLSSYTLVASNDIEQDAGTINLNTGTLEVNGTFTNPTASSFNCGTGTFYYNSAASKTWVTGFTFYNFIINCSGFTFTLAGTTTISRDATITLGTLDVAASTLNIGRNFSNEGTLTATSGLVKFNGGAAQTISGAGTTTFHDITIDNSSGDVALSVNASVTGTLTMTTGDLTIATTKTLTITDIDDPGISGGSTTSMIITSGTASVVKNYSSITPITFPFGNGTKYRPITITPSAVTASNWTVSYTPSAYSDLTLTGISSVSMLEYWSVNQSVALTATVQLTWHSTTGVSDYTLLKVAKYNGTDWAGIASTPSGTNTSGNLPTTAVTTVGTSTSYWALGSSSGVNTLPIELVSFTGNKEGTNNELKWTTVTELNNDYFTIEKTYDGTTFEIVGVYEGAGNSNSTIDYTLTDYQVRPTINYYRLKQTDFDGNSTFSEIISIDNSETKKEIVMKTNILGQEINEDYRGMVVIVYSDGSSIKVIQ